MSGADQPRAPLEGVNRRTSPPVRVRKRLLLCLAAMLILGVYGAGICATAFLYWEGYYGCFGVSARDVGLTLAEYNEGGPALFALLCFALLFYQPTAFVRSPAEPTPMQAHPRIFALATGLLLVTGLWLLHLQWPLQRPVGWPEYTCLGVLAIPLTAALIFGLPALFPGEENFGLRLLCVLGVTLVFAGFAGYFSNRAGAAEAAREVRFRKYTSRTLVAFNDDLVMLVPGAVRKNFSLPRNGAHLIHRGTRGWLFVECLPDGSHRALFYPKNVVDHIVKRPQEPEAGELKAPGEALEEIRRPL